MKGLVWVVRSFWQTLLVLLVLGVVAVCALLTHPQATPWIATQIVLLSAGRVPVADLRGSLLTSVQVDHLVIDLESVRVEIVGGELDWSAISLLRQRVVLNELKVEALNLWLKDQEPQPPSDALTRLPFGLSVAASHIQRFSLHLGREQAPLVFDDIHLVADWLGDEIRIESARLGFAPVGVAELAGGLRLQPRAIEFVPLHIRGWGEATLQGRIDYDGRHFSARAEWSPLHWPQSGPALFRSAYGQLTAEGEWSDYRFAFRGPVESTAAGKIWRAALDAKGTGSLSKLQVEALKAETLGGVVQLVGQLGWEPSLAIDAHARFSGINPAVVDEHWPGRLDGVLDLNWASGAGPAQSVVRLQLLDSTLRDYPLKLAVRGGLAGGTWSLSEGRLQSGDTVLQARGDIWPRWQALASLRSAALQELWPDLAGRASVEVSAVGDFESPRVQALAEAQQLRYRGIEVAKARFTADVHPSELSSLRLELDQMRAGIEIASLRVRADGTARDHQVDAVAETELGALALKVRGALDPRAGRWEGHLAEGSGRPRQLPGWTLEEPAAAMLSAAASRLAPACWRSSAARACMQFRADAQERRGAFRLESLPFAYFAPLLPPGWSLTGSISGAGRIVEEAAKVIVDADLGTTAGELRFDDRVMLSFLPSQLYAEETPTGFVSRLSVPLSHGTLGWTLGLSAPAPGQTRRWSGRVQAAIDDISVLKLLSPELESVSGRVRADFEVSGAADAPRLQGQARLEEGRLQLYSPGTVITDVNATLLSASDADRYTLAATALSGGGSLRVEGSGSWVPSSEPMKVTLSGEGFQILDVPQAQVWVSPQLVFEWQGDTAKLTGEVVIPRALITPTELSQGIAPSRDQIIVRERDTAAQGAVGRPLQIKSQVRLSLGKDVRIDGLGLKTRLSGTLDAVDDAGRPTRARGQIDLVDGSYKAYGQDLTIETGRLLFTGGPISEPALELRATRKPTDAITVGISVRGTLDAPQFSLFSTPAMPQEQQLSWLVLGRSIEEQGAGAEQGVLAGAALSLGLSGSDYLAQKIRGGLRLDEVSIGAKAGESSEKAKLTVGKYLSPKLYVSYGIGLFQPGHAFRLQYDIGRGFKLSTETGVESGGDLLYTVEH